MGNIGLGWQYDVAQAKIIGVNTCDFERIRDTKEVPFAYKYIVFLDEYFPFHPDFKMFGQATIGEDIYLCVPNGVEVSGDFYEGEY